ncbi:hypothetical protein ACFLIM_14675 [Nonomuraea sp. M3C6]|uniref:Uncharacterized protein n=1 Tax=Nonomuraea marmarensis TaxID=3351344 RepID=A0ABW7AAQ7_9ACTN
MTPARPVLLRGQLIGNAQLAEMQKTVPVLAGGGALPYGPGTAQATTSQPPFVPFQADRLAGQPATTS